jgi:hypothetical protein
MAPTRTVEVSTFEAGCPLTYTACTVQSATSYHRFIRHARPTMGTGSCSACSDAIQANHSRNARIQLLQLAALKPAGSSHGRLLHCRMHSLSIQHSWNRPQSTAAAAGTGIHSAHSWQLKELT